MPIYQSINQLFNQSINLQTYLQTTSTYNLNHHNGLFTTTNPNQKSVLQLSPLLMVINTNIIFTAQQPQSYHPQDSSPACQSAIRHSSTWKPSSLDRRLSWSNQDQKHELQMSGIGGVTSGEQGFTERG